jgi:hypothetical protein
MLREAGRALAIVATWFIALAIGVVAFGTGSRPGSLEPVSFGIGFGLAALAAGVAALAVGGRIRLAIEAGFAIVAAVVLAAWVASMVLWLAPLAAQRLVGLGSQDLLRLRWFIAAIAGDVCTSPRSLIGPFLGVLAGGAAGALMRLGRRRPGLAAGLAVMLLVAVGASADAAGRVVTDVVLEARKEGGNWAVSSLTPDEVAGAIGAAAGAVVGAILACGLLRVPRSKPPTPATEEASR